MSQTKVKSGLLNFPDQTDFVKLPSGTTAQRPSSPEKGYSRYNTTDNKLEFWNGTVWQQLPGVVAPIITSISYPGDDLAADPAGGQTITINGSDFKAGATVTVDGTTPSVITFVSATEITFTAPAKTAGDYDIVVTNVDGGNATAVDGMTYNGLPSWTTPTGNLGSFPAGSTIPTITLVATEPDSGVVSYSVTTGALPSGLTLSGADIDGTVPSPAGETTYNFSVTASDDENQESTERAFNIVVYLQVTNTVDEVDPFGDSSGLALYKFDGDSTDESGNYSFSTASNVFYPSGVFNEGLDLLSNTSYASGSGLTSTFPLTFSFWVKPDASANAVGLLINKRTTATNGYSITGTGTTNGMGFLNNGGYAGGSTGIADNLATNTWSHIVVIMNTGGWESYVNGSYYNKYSGTLNNTSNEIRLGKSSGIGNWVGSTWGLDQFRVFNTELTPLEVESLYRERTVVCGGQADTLDILGDNSCIATYQLNGNANDLSGNYSGTPNNVSYGVGEFDLAGVFNGSSSFIDTGISTLSSPFSVSMWINENILASGGFFGNWNGTANDDMFWTTTSDGRLRINIDVTSNQYFGVAGDVSVNTWHHVVVSFNNGVYEVYLDSQSKGNATTANTSFSSGANFFIGKDAASGAAFFNGSIDQLRIFNKALNSSEVTTLYNETACDALACSGTTNTLDILSDGSCVAAYPLDGSPLDLSGNYNGVQTDVTYPQGYFDLAGSFNGVGYIQIPTLTIPNTTTISLWAKPNSTTVGGTLFSAQTSDYRREYPMLIWSPASSTYNGFAVIYTQNAQFITSSTVASANVWHHIVCIKNSDGSGSMYVDNVLIGTIGANTTHPQIAGFTLGAKYEPENNFLGDFFPGEIDQVRVFNKALSAGEVTTLYNETACN